MALQKDALKQSIVGLLQLMKLQVNEELAIELYSEGLSTIIDTYVRTAEVTGATTNGGTITNGQII